MYACLDMNIANPYIHHKEAHKWYRHRKDTVDKSMVDVHTVRENMKGIQYDLRSVRQLGRCISIISGDRQVSLLFWFKSRNVNEIAMRIKIEKVKNECKTNFQERLRS